MKNNQIIETNKGKARIFKGFTSGSVPATYKKVDVLSHNIGNNYNPSIMTIYKAKDKTLRYEIYRDGNFFPYYGRFEFIV